MTNEMLSLLLKKYADKADLIYDQIQEELDADPTQKRTHHTVGHVHVHPRADRYSALDPILDLRDMLQRDINRLVHSNMPSGGFVQLDPSEKFYPRF